MKLACFIKGYLQFSMVNMILFDYDCHAAIFCILVQESI